MAWYQMRFWIEDEYKDHKSGGWGWEQTKMEDPQRAERQWLAMAVSMLMAVLVGGQEETREQEQKRQKAPKLLGKRRVGRPPKPIRRERSREQSCLMRGQQAIQAAVVRGEEIPMGHVVTEAWPVQTFPVSKPTKSWVKKRKEKEAKKRYQKNKQARPLEVEQTEPLKTEREQETKDQVASPPKQVQKRELAEKEREAKRLLARQKRESRKREQDLLRIERTREAVKEEIEQERKELRAWYEELSRKRELRVAQEQEARVRLASGANALPPAPSTLFVADEALVSLPKPP